LLQLLRLQQRLLQQLRVCRRQQRLLQLLLSHWLPLQHLLRKLLLKRGLGLLLLLLLHPPLLLWHVLLFRKPCRWLLLLLQSHCLQESVGLERAGKAVVCSWWHNIRLPLPLPLKLLLLLLLELAYRFCLRRFPLKHVLRGCCRCGFQVC